MMTHRVRTGILSSPASKTSRKQEKREATVNIKNILNLAVLASGLIATSAQATPVNSLNFTTTGGSNSSSGTFGNTWTFNMSGIIVTATGWSAASSGSNLTTAQLGRANGYGLYVCNPAEGLNCSPAEHQIDNNRGFDFVLFQFSELVDPSVISIRTHNNADLDVSYWLGNTASNLSLAGVNLAGLAGLGFGNVMNDDVNGSAISRNVFLANNSGVNSLLLGARVGGDSNADYFKITGMSTEGVSGVPEPSTVALTGAALVALGLFGRRRKA
jgi:hypothetical protein